MNRNEMSASRITILWIEQLNQSNVSNASSLTQEILMAFACVYIGRAMQLNMLNVWFDNWFDWMDERVSVNFVKFVSTLVPFGSLVSHVSSNATPIDHRTDVRWPKAINSSEQLQRCCGLSLCVCVSVCRHCWPLFANKNSDGRMRSIFILSKRKIFRIIFRQRMEFSEWDDRSV